MHKCTCAQVHKCTSAQVHGVPSEIPMDVVDIHLIRSNITQLYSYSFSNCINVTKLYISSNRHLSMIHNGVFRGMPKLEKIVLTGNSLLYNVSSFPGDTFEGLPHLKSININRQKLYDTTDVSLDDFAFMMHKLPRTLKQLKIDIPSKGGFSRQFMNFTKLGVLEICNEFKSAITFTNDTFKYLSFIPLKKLRIRTRRLSRIQPLAFHPLTNLTTLDVKLYNMSVTDFFPALIGLKNTTLKKLTLSTGTVSRSVILNQSFCDNLHLPHLTELHMDHAELYDIKSKRRNGCFYKLEKLEKLDLSFNYLSTQSIKLMFRAHRKYFKNLLDLNIGHQKVSSNYHGRVMRYNLPQNLKKLDMSRILNHIPKIEIDFPSPTRLEYLIFQGNVVKVLRNITVNRSDTGIPFEADFSRNSMTSFTGSFDNSLKNGLKVVSLFMSENRLGRELAENGDQVFKYFKDLSKLNLSTNDITTLPALTFENNTCLENLTLARNSLSVINLRISHMRNLKILDLSDNLLSQLDTRFQNELESIKSRSTNFTINMLRNPFQCSCETRQFLEWMYHKQSMFMFYDNYTCIHNNTPFDFKNMIYMLDLLNFQCSQNLFLKVSASLLAFLILAVAVSVFLYRHKWDIRFFCLRFITNRKAYQELLEINTTYEYDAFVSYHSDDRGWVRDELYENIDMRDGEVDTMDQPRFRLCIHDRDFIPGEAIEENIWKAIESSRKTIVVLSKNFLKSAWCEFELQIARKECVEKGRNLIIAVMLEPLSVDDKMSRSVERLIRKKYVHRVAR